jgi:5'-nucleotidase (lipoprotein e(P4) family)
MSRCFRNPRAALALSLLCLLSAACQPRVMEKPAETGTPTGLSASANDNEAPPETDPEALTPEDALALQDERLGGTLWMQTAAEFPALSRQAFALARLQLDQALRDRSWTAALEQEPGTFAGKPPAIIVDVDETVLDNGPFQAQMLADGNVPYEEDDWNEWAALGEAEPMDGAKEFLDYAASRGVEVFYVTNRAHEVEDGTRSNLVAAGFPVSEETDTLLTKRERPEWESDKQTRRAHVAETHRILLLVGDDLNDFASGGRATDPETRIRLSEEHRDKWGSRWILLPNPVYGSWEASLFGRDYDLTRKENLETKRRHLRPYRDPAPATPEG